MIGALALVLAAGPCGWVESKLIAEGNVEAVLVTRSGAVLVSMRELAGAPSSADDFNDQAGENSWIVRRSDDGEKWMAADSVRAGWRGVASAVAVVPDGGVIVVGTMDVSTDGGDGSRHWVVRASRDGTTWNTIDDVVPPPGQERWADRVVVTPRGAVLVFGGGFAAATNELHQDAVRVRRWACGPVDAR